jgi:ATP-binding cassette, subfamily B, bacterial IrtB/YbtQ
MLKQFNNLLGQDSTILKRYLAWVITYAILCGVMIVTLSFAASSLLLSDFSFIWTQVFIFIYGIALCWWIRKKVEQLGIEVGIAILNGTRQRLGDHVSTLPLGWFSSENKSKFNFVITQGLMSVAQLPAHVFTPVITGLIIPIVVVIALCVVHGGVGLVAAIALPILFLVLKLSSKLSKNADEQFHQNFSNTSQRMVEFAQAQSTLRAFSGKRNSSQLFEQAINHQYKSGLKLILLSSVAVVLNSWAIQVLFAILFMFSLVWLNSTLQIGWHIEEIMTVMVALLLSVRFIESLLEVAGYSEVLRSAQNQLENIQSIFDEKALPEVQNTNIPLSEDIEVHQVSFKYANAEQLTLRDLSFSVPSGSMTALIGESGSGKSTLLRLISRFFDTTAGEIRVGGVDVRNISNQVLNGKISQIFQDHYLFSGTIAENIKFAKPEASDAELMNVIEQVGLMKMIQRLPNGIHSEVGEGGILVSGGERQRITIARALLKEAPILLVDEATAALDPENQAVIRDLLNQFRGKRTIVVIAHQLSTVEKADQIIVLEKGAIVEKGSPTELLKQQGAYYNFLVKQQKTQGWCITPNSMNGVM